MKSLSKQTIAPILVASFLATAGMAFAQDSETSDTSEVEPSVPSAIPLSDRSPEEKEARRAALEQNKLDMQAQFQEKKLEMEAKQEERQATQVEKREEMQIKATERRTALQARAQERITNLAANMSNRMDAVIERLQNITGRLETRITRLKELGVNTSDAEAALASARVSITAATSEIANIDTQVNAAVGSEDVKTSWQAVRTTFTNIRDHIKTAHTELRSCVSALKIAAAEAKDSRGVSDAIRNNPDTETSTEPES